MFNFIKTQHPKSLGFRLASRALVFCLSFSLVLAPSAGYAQTLGGSALYPNLPVPGTMVSLSEAFVPVLLKGMTIFPDDPFRFDFILDSGNTNFPSDQIQSESEKLVKYFLASLTIPKDDLWVNLSPYEEDRIIPEELGKTALGRDMLAQDYLLKQLTASLMYPEEELGATFWEKVYSQAQEKFGTTDIPVDTFNKVWILPESAVVYENGATVYVVESKLKVMLDSDYQAQQYDARSSMLDTSGDSLSSIEHSASSSQPALSRQPDGKAGEVEGDLESSKEIIKQIILPEIEREVNYGKNFAPLRQIYNSLILAKWYKETIKESLLAQVYVDQSKVAGVDLDDQTVKDQIYEHYMEAYQKGVYNYIREDYDALAKEVIPRKYFSGGIDRLMNVDMAMLGETDLDKTGKAEMIQRSVVGENYQLSMEVAPEGKTADQAMLGDSEATNDQFTGYTKALESKSWRARRYAVEASEELGDKRAVGPLELLLSKTKKFRRVEIRGDFGELLGYESVENPEYIAIKKAIDKLTRADQAMLGEEEENVGGIDMNEIEMERHGEGIHVQFDPAMVAPLLDLDIDGLVPSEVEGFTPIIINFVPVQSILPLLGLEPAVREEEEMGLSAI